MQCSLGFLRMLVIVMAVVGAPMTTTAVSAPAGDVSVTVTYKGKGEVDKTHEIFVFLFDHPDIGPASQPLAIQAVTANGGTAKFTDIAVARVYVAVAYDEKGDYDGFSGPPPDGTPTGIYSTDGKGTPAPVEPGPAAKIKITFDDSQRMRR